MLALARGMHIDLYSTSAFLLSFHEPTASIALDRSDKDATAICLLKRVRIGESGSGPDRPTASGGGGKEYLVVGTQSGNLSLIESPFVTFPRTEDTANMHHKDHTSAHAAYRCSPVRCIQPTCCQQRWAAGCGPRC